MSSSNQEQLENIKIPSIESFIEAADGALHEVSSTAQNSNKDSPITPDSDDGYQIMNLPESNKPIPIEIPDISSVSASSIDDVEHVLYMFEHQRWYLIGGWRQLKGIWPQDNDPPTYTSSDVTTCHGPWEDEEELFESEKWKVIEGEYTEEGGWVSASDWQRLDGGENAWGEGTGCQLNGGRPSARSTDRVRRRLWKRKDEDEVDMAALNQKPSPRTVAATDGAIAKLVFFEALNKLMQKQGLFALLDGSAWIRVVRRDVSHYKEWIRSKVLSVMRVGGGGGWLLAYPSLPRNSKPTHSARVRAPSSPESLRELCCGALHACAAYGYPMAQGWLGSVILFLLIC
mmetsp:Transcript_16134/g.20884  ORF Transcript_16134/g.20884 Transcript_16134/m.20884 type:complete len:344 (+) Transcript_16134:88-1119(+)